MDSVLERLREVCTGLPEVSERVSHGEPAWFAGGKKMFVMFADHHHDDRRGFWCAAAPGVQEELVTGEPQRYFRPPYVGHRGWLGVYLDVRPDWTEIAELVEDAYRCVASKKLVTVLDSRHATGPTGTPGR
ncbi:MmcQ/YjbR family DNA-binding protein [Nocardia seriolae]|uniref:Uncharacterized protein n=1 Tax=Nocardia seriolae TaxID=37332 RepID=A0A0B8N431_9NOCA|nr:MmcQ/YjbR family DNA-binding protein [Nocardia seriolae]APA99189.1 hypothetical protein NS506_05143 [Nocardia seriolae]MTJ63409.1 MmcQ/YjbR family DNA-binding protein [Nocardia seriolae]MTJ70190.1 MmcQ/YjbR family DNA-binding protein [Nocardia seriolae]MTJ88789.1 MmcQ/YjbR family DNA-binding protein [Nocardia seriolae]MTK32769.1 MmcQ/YjbR family DNA-binding protein [Nocardia seriolae]